MKKANKLPADKPKARPTRPQVQKLRRASELSQNVPLLLCATEESFYRFALVRTHMSGSRREAKSVSMK